MITPDTKKRKLHAQELENQREAADTATMTGVTKGSKEFLNGNDVSNEDIKDVIEETEEDLDLGYLLATLSRKQLELFVVKLISEQPTYALPLVKLSRRPLESLELRHELLNIFAFDYEEISEILSLLQPKVESSEAYLQASDLHNALTSLHHLCTETTAWYVAERKRGAAEEEDEVKEMETFYGTLEVLWIRLIEEIDVEHKGLESQDQNNDEQEETKFEAQLLDAFKNSSYPSAVLHTKVQLLSASKFSTKQLEDEFKNMKDWKLQLTPYVGPVFSDPIRALNKKLQHAAATTKA